MMFASRKRLAALAGTSLVLVGLVAAACNFPQAAQGTPVSGPDLVLTYAARTVEAQLTLAATAGQPQLTPGVATPTPPTGSTPISEATPTDRETDSPEATTATTPTAGACDRADFVRDITIPDNTTLDPGEEFTKTWQLRNEGTCTWTAEYAIVFDHGEAMGAPASAPLTSGSVPPNETVDVSIDLVAPQEPGTYQGFWKLRNQAGVLFGLGSDGDEEFWVKIEVAEPDENGGSDEGGGDADGDTATAETYDFIAQASKATWVGANGDEVSLTFGGNRDDPNGVARLEGDITLENGSQAGNTLIVHPKHEEDGEVRGTFTAYEVRENQHFKARLGFLEDCGEGQVLYQLWYKLDGDEEMLEEWEKSCEGNVTAADVDLSDLEGERVQFILVVLADGSPEDDLVIWGSARIE
jgi:hypothetical protein